MKVEHLNVLGQSLTAIKILSVWNEYIEILDKEDDGEAIALHDLAGTDKRATDKWVARLRALGIISYDNGVDEIALNLVRKMAADKQGLRLKERKETEGETPDETMRKGK